MQGRLPLALRRTRSAIARCRPYGGDAGAQASRLASGVAHGQWDRVPACRAAQLDQWWRHRGRSHDLGGRTDHQRRPVSGHQDNAVGEGKDAFESVFGHQHRQTEVVNQTRQRAEHLLGGSRVKGRRRLVEHQHTGRCGENCADRDPLLLTPREGAQRPVAQFVQAEQVDGVLDTPAHGVGGYAKVLHGVRKLVLDSLGHEGGQRVLSDVARRCQRAHGVDGPVWIARQP